MKYFILFLPLLTIAINIYSQSTRIKNSLIAYWDFSEPGEKFRKSKNLNNKKSYFLEEVNGPIEHVFDKAINKNVVDIKNGQWFYIPRDSLGELNIYGKKAQVTVIAWIKKQSDKNWQAIAGVWDETNSKRQYYLFANASTKTFQDEMVRYPAKNLIHGHISAIGGTTPGNKHWIAYASSNDSVEIDQWVMAGMTYNGKEIKIYINDKLSKNKKTNPFIYKEGIFNGGADGADFTVGANFVNGRMTNQFIGMISGLAVFNKALSSKEMKIIFRNGICFK